MPHISSKSFCYIQSVCFFRNLAISSTSSALEKVGVIESHDERNMRLKRPMSPHLTVYKFQITSILSISHRATGMILSGYAAVLGLSKRGITQNIDFQLPLIIVDSLMTTVLFFSYDFYAWWSVVLNCRSTRFMFTSSCNFCW